MGKQYQLFTNHDTYDSISTFLGKQTFNRDFGVQAIQQNLKLINYWMYFMIDLILWLR